MCVVVMLFFFVIIVEMWFDFVCFLLICLLR